MEAVIEFLKDVQVELLRSDATDQGVIEAAQVSHTAVNDQSRVIDPARFINALARQRHGSPFEHGYMQFRSEMPIFAARELMRHRIGFSYNEISGRYTKLRPRFYVPSSERPLVNVGKPMKPKFETGSIGQVKHVQFTLTASYQRAWNDYEAMLADGIAGEVARSVLPVGIMTEMVISCNPRSLMSFLSLRVEDETALFPSYPQKEIEMVAKKMEKAFAELMPLTHAAFELGRRAGV